MKVLLLKDVKGVGRQNQIKEVKRGYGLNFLLPNGSAVIADGKAVSQADRNIRTAERRNERRKKEIKDMRRKLDGYNLRIEAKVGEGGKLYGAITPQIISDNLKRNGFEIEKDAIAIEDPIKEAGEHEVKMIISPEARLTIKVRVVEEK